MQSVEGFHIFMRDEDGVNPEHARRYRIRFFRMDIIADVTSSEVYIQQWLDTHNTDINANLERLIVGIAVKCNILNVANLTASVLQLCIGSNCLIIRLTQLPRIPECLLEFINAPNAILIGFNNVYDGDYLHRFNPLFRLAHKPYDVRYSLIRHVPLSVPMNQFTMEHLVSRVYRFPEIRVDRNVLVDTWNGVELHPMQVMYASVEVFLSCLAGRDVFINWVQDNHNNHHQHHHHHHHHHQITDTDTDTDTEEKTDTDPDTKSCFF